ncbi:hypothetical protein ACFVUR_19275, partial [Stenotrophomonas bentonitica]|uniref:hypothetical protein n=1 Tax=Stenotrophomonas bentonitica TaxID=1450134 RepID=UPI0036E84476
SKKQILKQVKEENKRAREQRLADDARAQAQREADDARAQAQRLSDEDRERKRHRREMTVQLLADAGSIVSKYGENATYLKHADTIGHREQLSMDQWLTDIDVAATKLHILGIQEASDALSPLCAHFRRHWNEYAETGESSIDIEQGTIHGAHALNALREAYKTL